MRDQEFEACWFLCQGTKNKKVSYPHSSRKHEKKHEADLCEKMEINLNKQPKNRREVDIDKD